MKVNRSYDRTTVYMSHPISGDWGTNIYNANLWYRFLRRLSAKGVGKLLGERVGKVLRGQLKQVTESGLTEEKYRLVHPFDEPPVVIAPWLTCPVSDLEYVGGRARAMDDCLHVAVLMDENWQVGGRLSEGMLEEEAAMLTSGKRVRDLTHWGITPPEWDDTELFG